MGELELVARLDNRLLLRDATGAEYRLPICPKLKSMVFSGQAAPQYPTVTEPKPPAAKVDAPAAPPAAIKPAKLSVLKGPAATTDAQPRLRPAELQIRLRAGDTPEQLAQVSELTAEQIARFAGPIEAERAHIIRAMKRTHLAAVPGTNAATVGELVNQRLSARGITTEQLTWFARREVGAPWLIELKFDDGGRAHSARWTFDAQRDHLTALDDEARWLSSPEAHVPETVPITLHQAKRPAAVRQPVFNVEDEGPLVSGAPNPLPKLTKVAKVADVGADVNDAKDVAGIVPISRWQSEKLETVAVPVSAPAVVVPAPNKAKEPMGEALKPVTDRTANKSNAAEVLFESTATGSQPVVGRKGGRAKVPSWDQIVFGPKE